MSDPGRTPRGGRRWGWSTANDRASPAKVQGGAGTVQGSDGGTPGLPFQVALRAEGTRPKDERFHDPSSSAHCQGHHHRGDDMPPGRHPAVGRGPSGGGGHCTSGRPAGPPHRRCRHPGLRHCGVAIHPEQRRGGLHHGDGLGVLQCRDGLPPSLSSGSTGNFNGVVIADAPAGFAGGQLDALFTYESQFGVRQIDGSAYPSPALGQTAVAGAGQTLDNTTASLTPAGLAGLPGLKGTVPFAAGTFGTPATADAGAPFTPWIENSAGESLGGVYQHPASDPQAGVAELTINFNYNANPAPVADPGPGPHRLGDRGHPPRALPQLLRPGRRRRVHRRQRVELAIPVHPGRHQTRPTTPARPAWPTTRPTPLPTSRCPPPTWPM